MKKFNILSIIVASALIAGCSTGGTYRGNPEQSYTVNYNLGRVQSVNVIHIQQPGATSGGGAIIGGLGGGVIGNQFGKGNGRKAMTILGAVVGAGVGNSVESSNNSYGAPHYELFINLHNGQNVRIVEPVAGTNYYAGQYVKVYQNPKTGYWRAIPD